jgi:class 3 adenylate cyclase
MDLELALSEGAYRLRGPQLPAAFDFRVVPATAVGRLEVTIPWGAPPQPTPILRLGGQTLALTNNSSHEVLLRLERTAPREDAVTAARATSLAVFRELFPGEILSADQLVRVATLTFLVTELVDAGQVYAELGDAQTFQLVRLLLSRMHDRVRQEGGAVVKTVAEGILAVFDDAVAAVRVGLDLSTLLRQDERTAFLRVRAALHRGSALAANLNDSLDYFGATVNEVMQLPRLARAGELVLSQEIAADPHVSEVLAERQGGMELLETELPGRPGKQLVRLIRV